MSGVAETRTTPSSDGTLLAYQVTGEGPGDVLFVEGLKLRVGVHTGDVEVRGEDIAGLAVSIAKRVCDLAEPGEVLVSEVVARLVTGSGIAFDDRGEHELKGVPGTWRLGAVRR